MRIEGSVRDSSLETFLFAGIKNVVSCFVSVLGSESKINDVNLVLVLGEDEVGLLGKVNF